MDIRINQLCVVSLLIVALSDGRTLIGRHVHACQPMDGFVHITQQNCERRSVKLAQCIGTCISWDGLPENTEEQVQTCTCCKPVIFVERIVLLQCTNKNKLRYVKELTVKEPKACACLPCNRRRKRSQVVERILSPTGSGGSKI